MYVRLPRIIDCLILSRPYTHRKGFRQTSLRYITNITKTCTLIKKKTKNKTRHYKTNTFSLRGKKNTNIISYFLYGLATDERTENSSGQTVRTRTCFQIYNTSMYAVDSRQFETFGNSK